MCSSDLARIELKNVLQSDPKDAEAYFQLGRVHEELQQFRKAFGNYVKAEELNPALLENQARLGMIYLLLANEVDKAKEKIDFILSKDPGSPEGLLLKAAMMLKSKNNSVAKDIIKSVVADNPDNIEASIFLSSLYMSEKNYTDAIDVLDKVLKVNQNSEKLNKLLVTALMQTKDYERAEVIYKEFLKRNPNAVASYNNLATFYALIKNKNKAIDTLRLSIENDQDDVDRKITLIKYLKASDGNEVAIQSLVSMIDERKDLGKLRTVLAELFIINGDKEAAIKVYKKTISGFSEEGTGIDARISLATLYLSEKNVDQARSILEEAYTISPNNPKINFLRAKVALFDKEFDKAIISLRIVIKETPELMEAPILLANIYQFQKKEVQVNDTLNQAFNNNKLNAEALLMLAEFQLRRDVEATKIGRASCRERV